MARYAKSTEVSALKSREEIERTLARYGAEQFAYGWDQSKAMIGFHMNRRHIRFMLPMPNPNAREFTHTPARGQRRSQKQARDAYEQAVRQRYRALLLVIKAKLEAVETGITTFEDEFLAHTVLPNGQTVGDHARPMIARAYETGEMPKLLPAWN